MPNYMRLGTYAFCIPCFIWYRCHLSMQLSSGLYHPPKHYVEYYSMFGVTYKNKYFLQWWSRLKKQLPTFWTIFAGHFDFVQQHTNKGIKQQLRITFKPLEIHQRNLYCAFITCQWAFSQGFAKILNLVCEILNIHQYCPFYFRSKKQEFESFPAVSSEPLGR